MKNYRLFVLEEPHMEESTRYDCQADDASHAIEQVMDAYPGCEVLSLTVVDDRPHIVGPVLRESEHDEYQINPVVDTHCFWLSLANASVWIKQKSEHLTIEVYPIGLEDNEEISSLTVSYEELRPSDEVLECLDDRQQAAHKRFAPTPDDLWAELRDVPVNDKDEIEAAWRHFKAGSHREDVWRWFEATFPGFSVAKAQGHL